MLISLTYLLSWTLLMAPHPLHMSVSNIEVHVDDNSATIEIKLFQDDLLLAVFGDVNGIIIERSDSLSERINEQVSDYINRTFYFIIDEQVIKLGTCTNIKVDKEAVYLSYHLHNLDLEQPFKLFNTMLIAQFPDQKNLVFVNFRKETMGLIFNSKNTNELIELTN